MRDSALLSEHALLSGDRSTAPVGVGAEPRSAGRLPARAAGQGKAARPNERTRRRRIRGQRGVRATRVGVGRGGTRRGGVDPADCAAVESYAAARIGDFAITERSTTPASAGDAGRMDAGGLAGTAAGGRDGRPALGRPVHAGADPDAGRAGRAVLVAAAVHSQTGVQGAVAAAGTSYANNLEPAECARCTRDDRRGRGAKGDDGGDGRDGGRAHRRGAAVRRGIDAGGAGTQRRRREPAKYRRRCTTR